MKASRLLKTASDLECVPDKHFDMTRICDVQEPKNIKGKINKRKPGCGTVGCALGWLPTFFPRSGLKLISFYDLYPHHYMNGDGSIDEHGLKSFNITFDGKSGYIAAAYFFGIDIDEVKYLFDPEEYDNPLNITRQQVIERIRNFVKHKQEYQARCTSQNS